MIPAHAAVARSSRSAAFSEGLSSSPCQSSYKGGRSTTWRNQQLLKPVLSHNAYKEWARLLEEAVDGADRGG
jgi:hypothetical protein